MQVEKKLEELYLKKEEVVKELEEKTKERIEAQRQEVKAKNKVESINKVIEKVKNTAEEFCITEHAIVRYIERVLEIDVDKLRNRILQDIKAKVDKNGGSAGDYKHINYVARVRNNKIITIHRKGFKK